MCFIFSASLFIYLFSYRHASTADSMSIVPLAIDIAAVCCLAAFLLHRYGNWRVQHVGVTLVVFIAWYFSFMIIFTLPIDVSNVSTLNNHLNHCIINVNLYLKSISK